MGTDISEEDIENVSYLCEQIIQIAEYRMSLYDYLKNRMQAVAPNLTVLVGELVGARLIAHAGLWFPAVTERNIIVYFMLWGTISRSLSL